MHAISFAVSVGLILGITSPVVAANPKGVYQGAASGRRPATATARLTSELTPEGRAVVGQMHQHITDGVIARNGLQKPGDPAFRFTSAAQGPRVRQTRTASIWNYGGSKPFGMDDTGRFEVDTGGAQTARVVVHLPVSGAVGEPPDGQTFTAAHKQRMLANSTSYAATNRYQLRFDFGGGQSVTFDPLETTGEHVSSFELELPILGPRATATFFAHGSAGVGGFPHGRTAEVVFH